MRRATARDLDAILEVEWASFEEARRANAASIKRSLASRSQSVWAIDAEGGGIAAFLILWHFRHTARVYDIATHPEHRGRGLMRVLISHAETVAKDTGASRVILEAAVDGDLIPRYERLGYVVVRELRDFYREGVHAARLEKRLS